MIELNPHELGAHAHYATTLFLSEVGARTAAYDKIVRRVSKTALGLSDVVERCEVQPSTSKTSTDTHRQLVESNPAQFTRQRRLAAITRGPAQPPANSIGWSNRSRLPAAGSLLKRTFLLKSSRVTNHPPLQPDERRIGAAADAEQRVSAQLLDEWQTAAAF